MKLPLTLAIETSNPSAQGAGGAGVALVGGRGTLETIGVEAVDTSPHTDDLVAAIDRLFRRSQRVARDLTRVAISAGPGGFTAVRLAVTAGKMICEATGAECVGVPTAHALARRVASTGSFGVALSSKGDTTHLTRFSPDARALDEGRLIDAPMLESMEIRVLIADQFLPAPIRERAAALGIPVELPTFDPVAVAEAAERLVAVDPAALLPIYPREPEAVTKWRQLHGPRA